MTNDPMVACAIAIAGTMLLMIIKPMFPSVFWGVFFTIVLYGIVRLLKSNGNLWKK